MSTIELNPWAYGPFEIILHAETHYRNGEDFDRRIAIVGFDNAIEVSIHTYLNLHPIQRNNKVYKKEQIAKWLDNYHTKMDFLEIEMQDRGRPMVCDKAKLIWYHEVRNGQYHIGGATIPQGRELEGIRSAALWIFGTLYDVADCDSLLDQHLNPPTRNLPQRTENADLLIDREYGTLEVAGKLYYSSDVLYALDPVLYSETAAEIQKRDAANAEMNNEVFA